MVNNLMQFEDFCTQNVLTEEKREDYILCNKFGTEYHHIINNLLQ